MKNFRVAFALAGVFLGSTLSGVEGKVEDMTTRVEFPDKVVFESGEKPIEMKATGVATRSKFFVKVYSVAHYMQDPVPGDTKKISEEVCDKTKAKQLTLTWVRGVDAKRIQEGFQESFEKTMSRADHEKLLSEITQFNAFFDKDAKEGDRYVIRWIPEGTIEVEVNGKKKGEINNTEFAAATWGIWLGPKSIVNRTKLVSLIAGQ